MRHLNIITDNRAATKGHIEARFKLGVCYELGKGVTQDLGKALEFYKSLAQVYVEAQNYEKIEKETQGLSQCNTASANPTSIFGLFSDQAGQKKGGEVKKEASVGEDLGEKEKSSLSQ
jgi:hypothetical protein